MLTVLKPLRMGDIVKPKKTEKTKGLKRTEISRKPGKRSKAKKKLTGKGLEEFFRDHGWDRGNLRFAFCQICGLQVEKGYAHPCHKERSWKGNHEAENLLAGHPECHRWMDSSGSQKSQELHARLSPVNMKTGGVVKWPEELWNKLIKAIKVEGLQQRNL